MRRKGARTLLREFFLENVGKIVSDKELYEVSGRKSEWGRRLRELRNEEGYEILSHNDRSDLKPGQYVLVSAKPKPAFARSISKETRAFVLDRNGFTCQMCGAVAGEPHPYEPSGRKTRLHLGHIVDKSHGGTDEPSNLRALCSVCNEGAANITPARPSTTQLLTLIRRARSEDQLEALRWLASKFPTQAKHLNKNE